ncbi:MAG: hypothetical protein U0174_11685 [Polyangiaceae bacterium]
MMRPRFAAKLPPFRLGIVALVAYAGAFQVYRDGITRLPVVLLGLVSALVLLLPGRVVLGTAQAHVTESRDGPSFSTDRKPPSLLFGAVALLLATPARTMPLVLAYSAAGALVSSCAASALWSPRVRGLSLPLREPRGRVGIVLVWALPPLVLLACLLLRNAGGPARVVLALVCLLACATFFGMALRTARIRKMELEVSVVAQAQAIAYGVTLLGFLAAAGAGVLLYHTAAMGALLAGTALTGYFADQAQPLRIARTSRRLLVCGVLGGPVLVLGVAFASDPSGIARVGVFACLSVLFVLGVALEGLARLLLPLRGAWLATIERATEGTLLSSAEESLRLSLSELGKGAATFEAEAFLCVTDPKVAYRVDRAGYLQSREFVLPEGLEALVREQPFGTLRVEILEYLEVRRPELRNTLAWMRARTVYSASVVLVDGQVEAMLLVTAGRRTEALCLDELHALRTLSDRLGGCLSARAALERSLRRERESMDRADAAADAMLKVEHLALLVDARNRQATTRLAQPATVGMYSAAAQLAFAALSQRVAQGAPVVVEAAPGTQPIAYLARAYLQSPWADSPFVVVDGTASRDHDIHRWTDPKASPLALADGGMLVLGDGAALPTEVQDLIARAHAERRVPWERALPIEFKLALTTAENVQTARDRMTSMLEARLSDAFGASIRIPRLRERTEDLRSIVIDRLAREGLRARGTPIGIDDAAYAELVEYPFDGDEAELASIVHRLVQRVSGDVIRVEDIRTLALTKTTPTGPRIYRVT